MADYIRVFDEDVATPVTTSDDRIPDDIPLLAQNGRDHDHSGHHRCLYGQKGFKHPAVDLQSVKAKKQLFIATFVCMIFMIAELIGGYLAGSLAVITDAAHLLSDCISFIVALCAICMAKRPADNFMSFGYKRLEVAGAVVSILGIWMLTGVLIYLAIMRTINWDFDIDADTMIVISTVGVAFNVIMAVVLHGSCGSTLHHAHTHSHSHSHGSCDSDHARNALTEAPRSNGDIATLPNPLNLHSTSFMTTHSRHNSFSKASGCNGGALLEDDVMDMQCMDIQRGSFDITLGRHLSDSKQFPHDDYTVVETNGSNQKYTDEVDLITAKVEDTFSQKSKNINVRAAMIHIIGDFIQSIGVLIAAIIIKIFPNAKIADPVCTFVFSIIVMFTTFHIFRDAVMVLLDAVPRNISLTRLEREIFCLDGVKSVHHLNVWSLSMDWNIMSVHLVIDDKAHSGKILKSVTKLAKDTFNIQHVTCQIEKSSSAMLDSNHMDTGPDVTL
ncbi:zinc transporter 2 [Sergentomyia squamirostris]